MLPIKIDLTKELAAKLRELRINNPVNDEVLTAENLSKAIGNNRAWMSQIESRRLKKIKREDIIAIYKLLFNISSDQEAEDQAELDLIEYITQNPKSRKTSVIASAKTINDTGKPFSKYYSYEKATPNNPDDIYKEECDDIYNYLFTLYDQAVTLDEKYNLCELVSSLSSIITNSDMKTLKLISEIPFHLLSFVSQDESREIYDRAKDLSLSLEKYSYRNSINLYHKNLLIINEYINQRFIFHKNPLLPLINYSFSSLINLIYNNSYPLSTSDKIKLINEFITILQKVALKYNIEFSIELLDSSSKIETITETLNLIQSFINSISQNNAYFMNKSSDYFVE